MSVSRGSSSRVMPVYVATYYKFGRYLLVCSSQPGGPDCDHCKRIWNDKLLLVVGQQMTTNINLEMNYWLAGVTNLAALNGPIVPVDARW